MDYDTNAPKKATNVSVNSDLLEKAKALDINLSQTLEQSLAAVVRSRARKQWLSENQAALLAYNEHIVRDGIFGNEFRRF